MPPVLPAEEQLERVAARVEPLLARIAGERALLGPPRLVQAIEYALLGGGKRLRPALVLAAAEAVGGDAGDASLAMRFALSLEMIHAYSLVHDDLPAMDDDDLRRGRPTVHKAFDEATAILVGDGLQSLAFQHLLGSRDPRAGELARLLATNAYLMVEGQALDMAAEEASRDDSPAEPGTAAFTEADILRLMGNKTAALIATALAGGALAGCGSARDLYPAGWKLGLAFQIADDLLDLTADAATLGKRTGKDAAAGKATLPSLIGMDEARQRATAYCDEALAALAPCGSEADSLRALARFAVTRRK
jgi:farnesyl diphosphate synthase/geranylgeranyl diphosphate synthase type II